MKNSLSDIDSWSTDRLAWEIKDLATKIPSENEVRKKFLLSTGLSIPIQFFNYVVNHSFTPVLLAVSIAAIEAVFLVIGSWSYLPRGRAIAKLKFMQTKLDERMTEKARKLGIGLQ